MRKLINYSRFGKVLIIVLKLWTQRLRRRKRCVACTFSDEHLVQDFNAQEILAGGGEIEPEDEDLFYLRRLDGGLFTLQTVDYILAWIVMEDDGVSKAFQKEIPVADLDPFPDSCPCHTNARAEESVLEKYHHNS